MRRFITSADDEIGKILHCSWVQCLWRLFFHSLTVSWTYECSHKARRWIDEFVRRSSIIGCVPRDHSDSDVSCATWGSIFGSDVQTFQTLPDIWVWSTRNKRMSGCFWALYAMSSGQTPRLSFGLVEPNVGYGSSMFLWSPPKAISMLDMPSLDHSLSSWNFEACSNGYNRSESLARQNMRD